MKKISVSTLLAAAAILFAASVAWHHRLEISCELAHSVHGICSQDILLETIESHQGVIP